MLFTPLFSQAFYEKLDELEWKNQQQANLSQEVYDQYTWLER